MWLASFKQHSAVYGKDGKSATSVGLRAPAGRFDAAKGGIFVLVELAWDNSGKRTGSTITKKHFSFGIRLDYSGNRTAGEDYTFR